MHRLQQLVLVYAHQLRGDDEDARSKREPESDLAGALHQPGLKEWSQNTPFTATARNGASSRNG